MAAKAIEKRIPKLRFPEFDEEWSARPLKSFGELKNGHNAEKGDYGTGTPFINLMDIFGIEFLDTVSNLGLVKTSSKDLHTYNIEYGDVLFVRSSVKRKGVGQACVVMTDKSGIVFSGFIIRYRPKPATLDAKFSGYVFNSETVRKKILSLATSSANTNINQESLGELAPFVPELPEQKKIASFLGAVDDKLRALRKKRDLLADYKRGVMQQIFSQEIRFTRDDGSSFPDWEEKKLANLLTVQYGKDHKELPKGDIPVLGTGGIIRHVNQSLHDGPSVLIGRKGTIDQPRFVTSPFWTVDTLFYSNISRGYVPYFVYLVVKAVNWLRFNEATGVPSLSASAIHGVNVLVPPSNDEQQKIADFLSTIDAKIEAVADQIAAMESFKKGLLQQMFV
ncbi:restriction endonuclease subunit S [Hyphococcus flavus]|uniref:Restriction endonuclease subunit S n=1 Tax=Hyphococcus flavus TaxID=1866326 RepID=A0AAF0CG33_9PROT|nr:restriction endonuclease subunit S [Hyphococcus flavus]WDI30267.1 restriction endonuclease subunit S [Hyphococcus flavus]